MPGPPTGPRRRALLLGATICGLTPLSAQAAVAVRRARVDRRVGQQFAGIATKDGAGASLTRVIGQPALPNLDPFILLDRFHSDDPAAYIAGFPDHPHRGFETVTVMRAGRMLHRDSVGNAGSIAGGGAQWMTAGRGIVHSEMPQQERGLMSGFQLWVNLPAREKLVVPQYQDLAPSRIATATWSSAGGEARIIAGQWQGLQGPVRARPTAPLLLTATLEDDRPFDVDVPVDHTVFVFVTVGEVSIGADAAAATVREGTLAILGPGDRVRTRATNRRSEILLAAGRPLREPIVQRGPFVMNTEAEIARAFADYRAGVLDRP